MFNERIKKEFQFLVDWYGFAITWEPENVVEYVGERCRVLVSVEKGGEVVVVPRSNEPQIIHRRSFTLQAALQFLDPTIGQGRRHHPATRPLDAAGRTERELSEQARLLREHCEPFLQGDFSIGEPVEQQGQREIEPLLRRLRGGSAPK